MIGSNFIIEICCNGCSNSVLVEPSDYKVGKFPKGWSLISPVFKYECSNDMFDLYQYIGFKNTYSFYFEKDLDLLVKGISETKFICADCNIIKDILE